MGLKQRKSLEDKESKTKVCQYLYKKIQLPLEGLSLEWIDTLEQEWIAQDVLNVDVMKCS